MAKKKNTFEENVEELREICEILESEDLPLDDALNSFEKGIKSLRQCESHLRKAEGRLKELVEGPDGELAEIVLGNCKDLIESGEYHD